jgi:hypothetical protein
MKFCHTRKENLSVPEFSTSEKSDIWQLNENNLCGLKIAMLI